MSDKISLFDAHAHVITGDVAAYPPAPISGRVRSGAMDDPMTAERLLSQMDANGVHRAALVQRAHIYGYDNSYVVDAASRHPDRFGAICVIDTLADDAAGRASKWLDRGAVGIRLTEPARDADGAWLQGPQALRVWDTVADGRATISIQLYTWNRAARLPELPALLEHYSGVPVIIEHLSNIAETAKAPDFGVDSALDALAALPNAILKLTTINLARCRTNAVPVNALIARIVSGFGAERLVWGSDVAQSPQAYEDMTALARAAVEALPEDQRRAILAGTADRLFGR